MKPTHSASSNFRVLLVQVDVPLARRVAGYFAHMAVACHRVAGRHGINQALGKVKPHLVVWDAPADNGSMAIGDFRQVCHIPIILLAHEHQVAQSEYTSQQLVDDYVLKPFEPKALALRVIAHLRQMKPPELHQPHRATFQRTPTEWLPYGWSACKWCGYRGRVESFLLNQIKSGADTEPPHIHSCAPDNTHRQAMACPRCGQTGSIESAVA